MSVFQNPTDFRIGTPNTIVTYFNGNDASIGETSGLFFYPCLFSGRLQNSNALVEHKLPFDAILTNAVIDIIANLSSVDVIFTILINGIQPPVENRCTITILSGQVNEVESVGSTFVKKGGKVSWQMSNTEVGQIEPNHIGIDVIPA